MSIINIEKELNKLILKALKYNEVPIAAIIIKNGKIISKAYNKVNKTNNFMDHAEIISIKKAIKKLKNWRLKECIMYVSLEPCAMCKEIIKKSRIEEVYYFVNQNAEKTEKNPNYKKINSTTDFSTTLKKFFVNRR